MKVKFNLFERVAGFFVLGALGGAIVASVSVAYKKGWFSSKVPLQATFESAEGLHIGTKVQISGLRAGAVTSVDLLSNNKVRLRFSVLEKFSSKIRKDSLVHVIRPFVIGEKVLEISVGSATVPVAVKGDELEVAESIDLLSLLSGKNLGNYLNSMGQLTENLKILLNAFSDRKRFDALISTLDEINPLVVSLNQMSKRVINLSDQLTERKKISRLVGNLVTATDQINPHIPILVENSPQTLKDMSASLNNLVVLSEEMKKVLPALAEIAPDLPQTSRRMVEAIDEAVITMKAIQKTFFIRGKVEEVKEEESKRLPANE